MKTSLLVTFDTKYGNLIHRPVEYFQRILSDLSASKGETTSFSGVNMKDVQASLKVSLRLVYVGLPHVIGECLLLPPALDVTTSVLR
jgi:hypothetical protein